jgi:hypothetical protein
MMPIRCAKLQKNLFLNTMNENNLENFSQQPDNILIRKTLNRLGHYSIQDVLSLSRMSGKWNKEGINNALQAATELMASIHDQESIENLKRLSEIFSNINTQQPAKEEDPIYTEIVDLLTSVNDKVELLTNKK